MKVGQKSVKPITGLPETGRYSNIRWSPDETMIAFTNTTDKGVELWILNVAESSAKKLIGEVINANLGNPYSWSKDNQYLLVKMLPEDKQLLIDKANTVVSLLPWTMHPLVAKICLEKIYEISFKCHLDYPDPVYVSHGMFK